MNLPSPKEPAYLVLLKTLLYAFSTLLLLKGVLLPSAQLGAILGVLVGVPLAGRLVHSSIRRIVLYPGILLILFLTFALQSVFVQSSIIPRLFGVWGALNFSHFFTFGILFFLGSLTLRALALKRPTFALLEVALMVGAVVQKAIRHRHHNFAEPRALSDWAWARGEDPMVWLMGLGALTLVSVAILLLERQRFSKVLMSGLLLFLIGTATFLLLDKNPIQPPPSREVLGLTGPPLPPGKKPEGLPGSGGEKKQNGEKSNSGQNGSSSKGGSSPGEQAGNSGQQAGGQNPGQNSQGGSNNPQGSNSGGQSQQQGGSGSSGNPDDEMPFSNEYPQGNPVPVAVVIFHEDYKSPYKYYYFRQTAFSQFNGTRLVRSLQSKADADLIEQYPTRTLRAPLEKKEMGTHVQIPTTVALVADHKQPFGLLSPMEMSPKENPNPSYFRMAYAVVSQAPVVPYEQLLNRKVGNPQWSQEMARQYLEIPNDPRYGELARGILAKLPAQYKDSPLAQAIALRLWLEKNSIYTRKSEHADAKDPTASFLFGDRRGYCVHLAHAMAYLLRSIGIPSRVSAGYAIPEARRGQGSTVLIQNQDAHAWAELYLEGMGWVVMDVGPERSEDEQSQEPSKELQRSMGELARKDPTAGKQPEPEAEPENRFPVQTVLWGMLWTLVGLLIASLLTLYGIKIWRRLIPRWGKEAELYRLSFRATLDRLADAGFKRSYGQSREEFAQSLSSRIPKLIPMTHAHLARALGKGEIYSAAEWKTAEKEATREIQRASKIGRRIFGMLNPISWIRVH